MPKVIRADQLVDSYKTGVAAKAQKWFTNFTGTTGIADAARSESAETRYNESMTRVLANKQRQKGLAGVTDADIKASVTSASVYSTPAQNKAPKFLKKFTPYIATINTAVAGLAAKTSDPDTNIDNRVKPIARALRAKKVSGV